MTTVPPVSIEVLRKYIGRNLDYQGRRCQVIDVLEDGPQLVLKVASGRVIQADQWGDAHRRTPESFSVEVYDADSGNINPLLQEFLSALNPN